MGQINLSKLNLAFLFSAKSTTLSQSTQFDKLSLNKFLKKEKSEKLAQSMLTSSVLQKSHLV